MKYRGIKKLPKKTYDDRIKLLRVEINNKSQIYG